MIPQKLQDKGLFCLWKYEERDGRKTKVPYDPNNPQNRARVNDRGTFSQFEVAQKQRNNFDGLGILIFGDFAGIDIDHCIDDDGKLSPMAEEIIETMDAYTETSPSGRGIRILFAAPRFSYDTAKYYINKSKIGLEVYLPGMTKKFLTLTGNTIRESDIVDRTKEMKIVVEKYMQRDSEQPGERPQGRQSPPMELLDISDQELLEKAMNAKSGNAFTSLWNGDISGYPSHSEADQALCNQLAFWTNRDPGRMDALFRQSGLMRDKWDRKQSGTTYGRITITKAIDGCSETYSPKENKSPPTPKQTSPKAGKPLSLVETLRKLDVINNYPFSDIGSSRLFSDVFGNQHKYNSTKGEWDFYDGVAWVIDRDGLEARASAKRLCDALRKYGGSLDDVSEDKMKQFYKFIGNWSSGRYRSGVITDSRDYGYITNERMDLDDYILNVRNGTLRLYKGNFSFSEHNPEDLLSKVANVDYDPTATAPRWEQFMKEIMQDVQSKIDHLQKLCGLCLTGNAELEKMWFLYGSTTRNGKSTFIETLSYLLGNYAVSMKPESLAIKNNDSRTASGDIARLAGTRLVIVSEIPKRMPLDTSLLKSLTGRDVIVARHLHQSEFEFVPKFKLLCNTNFLPYTSDTTIFKSDRVSIIGFDKHFSEQEQDKQLKNKLKEELSGILNWCIEGLKKYYDEGLIAPEEIQTSTEEYAQSSDKLGSFIRDILEKKPGNNIAVKKAYEEYSKWCDDNGFHIENKSNFIGDLKAKGIYGERGSVAGKQVRNIIVGYDFISDEDDFVEVPENLQEELPFT